MFWPFVITTIVYLLVGTMFYRRARSAEASVRALTSTAARLDAESRHYKRIAEWAQATADEQRALFLEERALARELLAQLRKVPTFAKPEAEPGEYGEPLTIAQADRLVVDAERRRLEQEQVAELRRQKTDVESEEDAPDLAGMEPVPIRDDEAMPVPRITESYGDEDGDDGD